MTKRFSIVALVALSLASCSQGGGGTPVEPTPTPTPTPTPDPVKKIEIKISPSLSCTRATDYGFEQDDKIGLYVVNYNGSSAGSLQNSGNHVDNMRFTYSGTWTPDQTIYWKDETTHADMYLYYPYASVSSVTAVPFEVKADQSSEAAYKASEFFYGKAANVAPTESATTIEARHLMSRISIKVEAGNGFTAETLAAANPTVMVNGVVTHASIDLTNGSVAASGDAVSVKPWLDGETFKALLVPQTVEESNLITVTVEDREYNLTKGFTFESGKNHTFTVTVSKTSNGLNVGISPWEDDGEDHGGVAE